ncbi:MAG: transketolase, partial [Thermoplasmata archaeon]|nr:transketolase [Thermoplasmata archaeon]
ENHLTPGVETTTGPLGQGVANGVGFGDAERFLAQRYNRPHHEIVDHRVYAICSDGDLMEGVASEAASIAGQLALGKLIYLYDDNHISIEGPTEWAFTEDVGHRFQAYGWQVIRVADGNDLAAIEAALWEAKAETGRPSLICIRTHIGFGSPVQDTREAHGEPLGPANTLLTKEKLGWPVEPPFLEPPPAAAHLREAVTRGERAQGEWDALRGRFEAELPAEARQAAEQLAGTLPSGWETKVPKFLPADGPLATRDASQKTLAALGPVLPALVGGAADLSPSTKTLLPGSPDYSALDGTGRNFHFGVREHAMVAILNGMALHEGVIPYGGTFLVFSDYARGALRLAALQEVHAVFVFTHDSIGMGEDGPTHQPIEHLASLRAIPGFNIMRPADANETAAAWRVALSRSGPTALVLTRQKLPVLDPTGDVVAVGTARGGYVLREDSSGRPNVILVATGSEVALALEAQARLAGQGVGARVVSLPSWRVFDEQVAEYRESVLPSTVPKVSIEAGATLGWARYVGSDGESIGIDRFGASAPGSVVQRELGFTADHVLAAVGRVLARQNLGKAA